MAIVTGQIALWQNKRDEDARSGSRAGWIIISLYILLFLAIVALARYLKDSSP